MLGGKLVSSDLTRLSDTLQNISRGVVYAGSVIAYNPNNDTISAPFTLDLSSTGFIYSYQTSLADRGIMVRCVDLYTNQQMWTYSPQYLLGGFLGTPVVVNDTLYANYDISYVFALNAKTGAVIWRSPQLTFTSQYDSWNYPNENGPLYSDGKVYTNTGNGITCLNSATGQILWVNEDGNNYYTTPVVDNGKVIVGIRISHYGIPDTFAVKAIDVNTGATIWNQVNNIQSNGTPIVCNNFVLYNTFLVNGNPGSVIALDESTGAQVWASSSANFTNDNPVHYGNLMICWVEQQLEALNVSTGQVVWQSSIVNLAERSDPFVSQDTVFYSQTIAGSTQPNQFQLVALSARTGAVLWISHPTPGITGSYLCVAGGRIYMDAGDFQSLNVYSTKDGSFITNIKSTDGAISLNGVSYYSALSGMEQ